MDSSWIVLAEALKAQKSGGGLAEKNEGEAQAFPLPNLNIQNSFPQKQLLSAPELTAFISHGGMHSVSEALAAGVPPLIIPHRGKRMVHFFFFEARTRHILCPVVHPPLLSVITFTRSWIRLLCNTLFYCSGLFSFVLSFFRHNHCHGVEGNDAHEVPEFYVFHEVQPMGNGLRPRVRTWAWVYFSTLCSAWRSHPRNN